MGRDKLRCASSLTTGTSVGTELRVEKPVRGLQGRDGALDESAGLYPRHATPGWKTTSNSLHPSCTAGCYYEANTQGTVVG